MVLIDRASIRTFTKFLAHLASLMTSLLQKASDVSDFPKVFEKII